MKSLLVSLTLALVAAVLSPTWAHAKVAAGDTLEAAISVTDGAGKTEKLSRPGHVVVLTFGASWCAPCKKELPAYEAIAKRYTKKKVTFVAVNVDQDLKKGKAFMKEAGLKIVRSYFDPKQKIVEIFDPGKMPTTYLMVGNRVHNVHGGYSKGDEVKLTKLIDAELAKLKK